MARLSVTFVLLLPQVHRSDWSSARLTMHWIGVVLCSLMCGAASIASLRFIIIDAKVRPGVPLCSTLPRPLSCCEDQNTQHLSVTRHTGNSAVLAAQHPL